MMAIPMSTNRVLRKCMACETKRHVLITELSLKVQGVSQDKDSERTSRTSKGNFLVEVDRIVGAKQIIKDFICYAKKFNFYQKASENY